MGKGARNREKYTEVRKAKKEQAIIEAKKQKLKKKVITIVSAVMAVIILVTSSVYFFFYANGKYLRDTVVVATENFIVNNAMMTYLFKCSYLSMQSQYGEEYFALITGIDTEESLKIQYADTEYTTTWFDTVLDSTKTYLTEVLMLAEAATAAGVELDENDLAKVDEEVSAVDSYLIQDGVSTSDVKDTLLIIYLAEKYENIYMNALEISSAEVNAYYSENMNTYRTTAYRAYTLNYTEEVEEGVVSYTQEQATEKAEELEAASSAEEFDEVIYSIVEELNPDMEEEDIQTQVDSSLVETGYYTEGDEFSEWAFGDDSDIGDTTIILDEENQAIIVGFLVQDAQRDEDETRSIRQILVSTSYYDSSDAVTETAEKALEEYNADPSVENFEVLAKIYSNDTYTSTTGGLYTSIQEGELFTELDEWLFDDAREVGDVEIVSSDYGEHVVYYEGEGEEAWYESVLADLKETAYSDQLTLWSSEYSVISNSEAFYEMPV